ncbi:uncharacterized protein LOC117379000 [Periophthalmus magnuspinnatus]|uniref:uncharacterized protein LOC117379000 n=1 Tax=Periophthalmus magnuspinnatus TaxID=409849 RepID=UPI00145ABE75|nr:uncharacterized protein LOC117379000 [Periophthalmus magnuspinnatus]
MAHTWILVLICVTFAALSSASPPQSLVVRSGSNVSLSCNLSSSEYQTWFRLDSEGILPLFSVRPGRLRGRTIRENHHTHRVVGSEGDLEVGVSLEIRAVTKDDSGVYICSSKDRGELRYNTAVHLTVTDPGDCPLPAHKEPCWRPGLCLIPGVISGVFLFITVFLCYCKVLSPPGLITVTPSSMVSPTNPSRNCSFSKTPQPASTPGPHLPTTSPPSSKNYTGFP